MCKSLLQLIGSDGPKLYFGDTDEARPPCSLFELLVTCIFDPNDVLSLLKKFIIGLVLLFASCIEFCEAVVVVVELVVAESFSLALDRADNFGI